MGKTVAQKIFDCHLVDDSYSPTMVISLDKVYGNEITTPQGLVDLEERGLDFVFDRTKIKFAVDHVVPSKDSLTATEAKVMRDFARRHNIEDFYEVGNTGVCHALFPEKGFSLPGNTIIMGDSHTCTHGAFGAFACGVGTTALSVGIIKGIAFLEYPKSIEIILNGKLQKGVFAKDVILFVLSKLSVNGATNLIIEFKGPVIEALNMEERMTVCNMAVEAGATSGIIAPDMTTVEYLWPYINTQFASKMDALKEYSRWKADADAVYEKSYTFDLTSLEPLITVKFTPDQVIKAKDADIAIDQVYIGSCTNGRYSDLVEAANILKGHKIAKGIRGIIAPATTKIYRKALDEGLFEIFLEAGFLISNPTCGACLGMSAGVLAPGEVAVSTTNRNFNGRMGKGGMVHLASPATAAASAITGKITDPRRYMEGGM